MPNKFYEPGTQRAAKVEDLFATIAPRYDLINDLQSLGLHRRWKRKLIKLAALKSGERALDLCCGTGDVAFALAKGGGEVVGIDFSSAMLAMAEKRMAEKQTKLQNAPANLPGTIRNPQFLRGDAQQISFPENYFDVVTVSYGLRNLSSWERGLEEMWRVAKPGGRLLVLDFGKPENALWRRIYFTYLQGIVPVFGKMFCGDSETHSYILESLKNYPAQAGVVAKMRALGCREVQVRQLLGGAMSINFGKK